MLGLSPFCAYMASLETLNRSCGLLWLHPVMSLQGLANKRVSSEIYFNACAKDQIVYGISTKRAP